MEGTGPGWLVPSSHKDHKMLPALTSDASKEFCNNRRGNKASQSSSFTDRNNSATQLLNVRAPADESLLLGQAPQSQAAARQGRRSPAHLHSGVYLLARAVAATQPIWAAGWHSPRSPERCRRGNSRSLSGRGARCGPAPGGQLSLLGGGGGCAPLCGQRRAASIAARRVRVRSPGAPAASGEPAPAPLNTAGQLSPRRKQHGGAARPAFHRPGAAAAAGALKTKRRTVTFHTVPFPPRAE
ncbi:uncharacterized protein [Agelaius tricolor]|uniref:uncharacterized protein isoform X2 n=1 Tax=Agelaius tricolor TaxID=9191 RepID=UPI0039F230AC